MKMAAPTSICLLVAIACLIFASRALPHSQGVWGTLLLVTSVWAGLAAIWYFSKETDLPITVVAPCFALLGIYLPIAGGSSVPVLVCAVVAGGYYIERRRFWLSALALSVTCIEPLVGLAACGVAYVGFPPVRVPLAYMVALIGGAEFWMSEGDDLARFMKGNSNAVLWSWYSTFGNNAAAFFLICLAFLLLIFVAFAIGRRAARILDSDSLTITLPVAAAILLSLGSSNQAFFALAFPAAFVVATRASSFRSLAWLALSLLAFPWLALTGANETILIPAFAISLLAVTSIAWFAAAELSTFSRMLIVAGAVSCYGVLLIVFRHLPDPSLQRQFESFPSRFAVLALILVAALQRKSDLRPPRSESPYSPLEGARITRITLTKVE